MCNISGYAGTKQAAPILVEMLKKQEFFDGGLSTGIATIDDDGNLYYAKVFGSVDDLIKKTDALNFPGTVGVIHSRPDDNFIEHASPIMCEDNKTAVVVNGNMCKDERLVARREKLIKMFLDMGVEFDTARVMEKTSYPTLPDGRHISYIELYMKYVEYLKSQGYSDYAQRMSMASTEIFSDLVFVLVSAHSPGNIYVSRITRSMNIMKTKDATYLSTSQIAFPELNDIEYMECLPQMETCIVNKDGFTVSPYPIGGGTVVDFTPEEYKVIEDDLRQKLTEKPIPLARLGGGIMVANASPDRFRPNVKATYDALWQFHKEGILKQHIDTISLPWLTPPDREIKTVFFSI